MQLYFIRHGQSDNNRLWALTGSSDGRDEDPALTELGRRQAERLAEFLRQPGVVDERRRYDTWNVGGFGLTHLYCSLMVRAIATGVIVARALDLPLVVWEEVHEVGGIHKRDEETGQRLGLPGKDRAHFEVHYPDLVLPDSLGDEGWWNRPYEEPEARPLRARRFLRQLRERHGGSEARVGVISHGGFHNQVLRAVLEMPGDVESWFSLNNTGITRIDFDGERAFVGYTNRVDFLPGELIT